MIKKLKEYLLYRRNKKIAKRELTAIAATTLPLIQNASDKASNIVNFVTRLAEETKKMEGEQLIRMVLDDVSDMLETDNSRIIEIFSYLANMSPEDIQKILVHSLVETIS